MTERREPYKADSSPLPDVGVLTGVQIDTTDQPGTKIVFTFEGGGFVLVVIGLENARKIAKCFASNGDMEKVYAIASCILGVDLVPPK